MSSGEDSGSAAPARALAAVREANRRPALVQALRTVREVLPGESVGAGGAASPAGPTERPSELIARYLAERTDAAGPTATREAGLAAVQVWQALSERVGRGAGTVEATILFTDLVEFSSWALEAGDELALELLREVGSVVEPLIARHRGRLVKRLGDGHMAVFSSGPAGVEAALAMQEGLGSVVVAGHRPRMRAGLHLGRPRRMAGDYLGTDVNIAARVGEAAGAGEVLVSDTVLASLDLSGYSVRRKRGFRAKGAPKQLQVYVISPG